MKKVLFSAIVTGVVAFASCGGNHEDATKKAADSVRVADSLTKRAEFVADSLSKVEASMVADTANAKKDTAAAPATK
jgi:hypothetical protein